MTKKTRLSLLIVIACQLAGAGLAGAEPISFNVKDPKGVNSIGIFLDSKLEPMRGVATGISGEISFDPTSLQLIQGWIRVETNSVQMTNSLMTKKLHEEEWLDAKTYPFIEAKFTKLVSIKKKRKNVYAAKVKGTLTLKNTTKTFVVPVTLTYLKDQVQARNYKGPGDLLIVRATLRIDRHDFDIKPKMGGDIVAREIALDIALVGASTGK